MNKNLINFQKLKCNNHIAIPLKYLKLQKQKIFLISSVAYMNIAKFIFFRFQQLNMIENRQLILRKQTKDIPGLSPKLLSSEVQKVKDRTKLVGQAYSLLLLEQSSFKTKKEESQFYQHLLELIISILKDVFNSENFFQLRKQIHRLFRTNTFNTKMGYLDIQKKGKIKPPLIHNKIQIKRDVDYSLYRKEIKQQISQIKPYLHNRSCYKTKQTRSPIISLLHPTTEYRVFNFQRQREKQFRHKYQ